MRDTGIGVRLLFILSVSGLLAVMELFVFQCFRDFCFSLLLVMPGLSLMNISTLCNIEIFFFSHRDRCTRDFYYYHHFFRQDECLRSFFMNSMFSTQSKEY